MEISGVTKIADLRDSFSLKEAPIYNNFVAPKDIPNNTR
jgi:hypothetical protein